MNRHYAKQGEVPRVGEIWRPIGEKTTVFSLYLVDITIIGVPVPREREIVSVWPGRTLGSLLPRYYGSESTLDYHKLGFTPARVGLAGCSGSWVTHLCVDNGKSELGGASGSVLDEKVMWMRWRLQASYGLSRELLDVPVESAMEGIRFSRPLISIAGTDTAGFMAEDLRVLGFLPHRLEAGATSFTADPGISGAIKVVPRPAGPGPHDWRGYGCPCQAVAV